MKAKLRRALDVSVANVAGLLWAALEIAGSCWRAVKRKVKRLFRG